jgi:hypothetical protein
MRLETTWIRVKIVVISEGRTTLAPARSSLRIICTGLNHHRFLGLEQSVIPLVTVSLSHYLWRGLVHVVIAFTEIPETDLVEIVETKTSGD